MKSRKSPQETGVNMMPFGRERKIILDVAMHTVAAVASAYLRVTCEYCFQCDDQIKQ